MIFRVFAVLFLAMSVIGSANAGYVHNDPMNNTDPTGEVTLKVGFKVKGPSANSQVTGAQGEVGMAVSIPIPGIDPAGTQADFGFYTERGGTVDGSGVGGLGKSVLVVGAELGDVQSMEGKGAEISMAAPYKIIPGKNLRSTALRTVARSVGGELSFDEGGNLTGAAATFGPGVDASGAGTVTSVVSIRSLAADGYFEPATKMVEGIRTPDLGLPSANEAVGAIRLPWDE